MINITFAYQLLNENNKFLDQPFETVKQYAEFSAENDPNFFTWLFADGRVSDYGQGMTEAQKEAYNDFILLLELHF